MLFLWGVSVSVHWGIGKSAGGLHVLSCEAQGSGHKGEPGCVRIPQGFF